MFKPSRRAAPCSRAVLTLGDAAMRIGAVWAHGPDLALAARNACVKCGWCVRDACVERAWCIAPASLAYPQRTALQVAQLTAPVPARQLPCTPPPSWPTEMIRDFCHE